MSHLAHANVARMRAPLDHAAMADFVAGIEPINRLAERSPGFVWRFRDEDDPEAAARVFGAADVLLNLSTWASLDALRAFTYASRHAGYVRRRKEWFARLGAASYSLWWVPEGHRPSPEEARDRLGRLGAAGPTPEAFTFPHAFAPPAEAA